MYGILESLRRQVVSTHRRRVLIIEATCRVFKGQQVFFGLFCSLTIDFWGRLMNPKTVNSTISIMTTQASEDRPPELELSDEDILDAMQHIPGYLDITTEDFRTIYHVAHAHAMGRLFGGIQASGLMRTGLLPLRPEMSLASAARSLIDQGCKGLPVVDEEMRIVGMLTETDFLRCMQAASLLELLLPASGQGGADSARGDVLQAPVSTAMTAPVIVVDRQADFRAIMAAFHRHTGHSMPVVDAATRFCGLLSRKQFLAACPLADLPTPSC